MKRFDLVGFTGTSYGTETLIGAPKIGGFFRYNFQTTTTYNYPFSGNSLYIGLETSMCILFAGAFSAGINGGVKMGPFTLDHSISKLWLINPDGNTVGSQKSYNPKIGFVMGHFWLKAGPAYILSGDYMLRDRFGLKHPPFNIELLFLGRE